MMKSRIQKSGKLKTRFSLPALCGAMLMPLVMSVLVVACGSNNGTNTAAVNLNGPVVTVTINMNNKHISPTPTLPPYWCGAWAQQTTPSFNNGKTKVVIYGKFVQNDDKGNPAGVDGADATAQVFWPGGASETFPATTAADGVAMFSIPTENHDTALNRVTLVTVT